MAKFRRDGYEIIHDLPGDGFNVDHLVVGPNGVFVIETKTYSKPVGRESRVAFSDGNVLIDGYRPKRNPLNQTRSLARWVRGLLLDTTGKAIPVQPVVIFPGWFVEPMPRDCDVWVLNEKPAVTFIRNGRGRLDETTHAQVCGQVRQYLSRQSWIWAEHGRANQSPCLGNRFLSAACRLKQVVDLGPALASFIPNGSFPLHSCLPV